MKAPPFNVANVITVSRVVLAVFVLLLLPGASDQVLWTVFVLTIFVIWADGLDGYFARKFKQSSKLGGILDIAGDRVVELAYWTVFAALAWIPLWVPLLFLVRGIFVDAIRSHLSEAGFTAFGEKTMMQSKVGKFLVASNFSRFSYAVAKALAFCLVIAAHTEVGTNFAIAGVSLEGIALFLVYFSCVFCLLRGLPVIIESRKYLLESSDKSEATEAIESGEESISSEEADRA